MLLFVLLNTIGIRFETDDLAVDTYIILHYDILTILIQLDTMHIILHLYNIIVSSLY